MASGKTAHTNPQRKRGRKVEAVLAHAAGKCGPSSFAARRMI